MPQTALRHPARARAHATNAGAVDVGAHSLALTIGAACAIIAGAVLVASGVTVEELALFSGFELAYALLPGLVMLRLLPDRPRDVAETIAVAWPLGMAVEIGAFLLSSATHQRWLFLSYPALAAAVAVYLLWLHSDRLRSMRLTSRALPLDWRTLGAALLLATCCMLIIGFELFATSPLPRTVRSVSYIPDIIFHISLAAEILHHWPPRDPAVAGFPIHYHIFANVDMAAAARATGVDLSTIVLRLQPVLLVAIVGTQLFVLGSKLGRRSTTVGFVTATLGLLAGSLNFSEPNPSLDGGPIGAIGFLFSPSYYMGAVFFLALLIMIVPALADVRDVDRRSADLRGRSGGYWLLVLVLSLAAGGAKASTLPVLGAGVVLFGLLQFRAHGKQVVTAAKHLAVVLPAFTALYFLLYRGGSEGETLKPAGYLAYTAAARPYHHALSSPLDLIATVGAAPLVLCALLLPLGGAIFSLDRFWPRRSRSSPERLLMCMLAVSLVPFLLLDIPGNSQSYFVVYGFLAAIAVSAQGVVRFARRLRTSVRELIAPVAVIGGGLLAVVSGLVVDESHAALVLGYLLAIAVMSIGVWLLRSRLRTADHRSSPSLPSVAVFVAVVATLVDYPVHVVLPSVERVAQGQSLAGGTDTGGDRELTLGLYRGLTWLRTHTRTTDVLAVNNHKLEARVGMDSSRYYDYSAFAERRVFLESWDFTSQGARYLALKRSSTPFPKLLTLNDAAVDRGSASALVTLYRRYGVRYIVIDRLHGPVPTVLPPTVRKVYSNSDVAIYRLERPPAAR